MWNPPSTMFATAAAITTSRVGFQRPTRHNAAIASSAAPKSVTNLVDRLEAQGLVTRTVDDADRRRVLASLTPQGKRVLKRATAALTDIDFAVGNLDPADQEKAYDLLRGLRSADFEG